MLFHMLIRQYYARLPDIIGQKCQSHFKIYQRHCLNYLNLLSLSINLTQMLRKKLTPDHFAKLLNIKNTV